MVSRISSPQSYLFRIPFRRSWITIVLVVFCIINTTRAFSPASASSPQPPRLAFEGMADASQGDWDIYLWDRTKLTNITQSPENEFFPIWSNDGRIAYLSTSAPLTSDQDYSNIPLTVNVWDGKTSTRVGAMDGNPLVLPSWSPKGQLAYIGLANGKHHVFVWDGTSSIDVLPGATAGEDLSWGADGRLAFTAYSTSDAEVYVWDGKTAVNISQHADFDGGPAWGPDGKLAFTSNRDGKNREIYIWDGKSLKNVSNSQEDDFPGMAWSQKGQLAWTAENGIIVWDGKAAHSVVKTTAALPMLQWSSNERLFVVYQDDQSTQQSGVWDGKAVTAIGATAQLAPENGGTFWSSDNRLAVVTTRALTDAELAKMQGPGGTTVNELTLWANGKRMSIPNTNFVTYAIWSSDNWLGWVAPTVNGDAVGLNNVYVWDGKAAIPVASTLSASDHPAWEPIH